MKILVVSNLYPPYHQGGYELRCRQIVEHLHRSGHEVRVVTSDYHIDGDSHGVLAQEDRIDGVPVSRFLRQHRLDGSRQGGRLYFLDVVRRQVADLDRFRQVLEDFRPDLVSWWNLEGVTKAMLRIAEDRGLPSVHCIDDNWMIREFGPAGDVDLPFWFGFWDVNWGPRPVRPLARLILAPVERRLAQRGIPTRVFGVPKAHVCFISAFWRHLHAEAGLDVRRSDVIYGGVAPERFFVSRPADDYAKGPLRLLYSGYIDRRRGLHTIVEALALMPPPQRENVHLSVAHAGPAVPDEYVKSIKATIAERGLSKHVTFLGRVPHSEMPRVYATHHVLVFASTRNEGMPMVMMEAMCAGCAVPNTGSGGAIELSDRADTPIFPKEHPFALSRLLTALEQDRGRVAEIALRGQQTVLQHFTMEQMLRRTTEVFERVAAEGLADRHVRGQAMAGQRPVGESRPGERRAEPSRGPEAREVAEPAVR